MIGLYNDLYNHLYVNFQDMYLVYFSENKILLNFYIFNRNKIIKIFI